MRVFLLVNLVVWSCFKLFITRLWSRWLFLFEGVEKLLRCCIVP